MDVGALQELIRRRATGPRPAFTAARLLAVEDGDVVVDIAYGVEIAYADRDGTPISDSSPVTPDTRFDLASITKLFTAAIVLETLADHELGLETPVAETLPAYRDARRREIRFRHLLGHTAGLPATWDGWRTAPGPEETREQLLALEPDVMPGTRHRYSCIGYLHAGFAVEALTSRPLDELLATRISGPLGLTATGYRPDATIPVAATEWQELPDRGVTRGAVHDETARALGGIAGNAGIFSTAADLARFGEALRLGASGILRDTTRGQMLTAIAPHGLTPDYEQAAGPRIGDATNFGRLAAGGIGHTGFTGTMLLMHPARRLTLVALTNRVHPSREWSDPSVFRREVAEIVAGGRAIA